MSGARHRKRPERLHQMIARKMGSAILTGAIQPGALLDRETEQAQALGVSRTPYREALKTLIAKGLLESRPKTGTRVTERSRWNFLDPDVLAWIFSDGPDPAFVANLFDVRTIIEPAAAALAALNREAKHLEDMESALEGMQRHGLATDAGQVADRAFHNALLTATGNEVLAALSSTIGAAVEATTRFKAIASTPADDPVRDHRRVFDAIAAGDAGAARAAMDRLLADVLGDMKIGRKVTNARFSKAGSIDRS